MIAGRWIVDEETTQTLSRYKDDPLHLFSQSPEDREMLLDDAIRGKSTDQRAVLARIAGKRKPDISQISAMLMAHIGIDPVFVAVATRMTDTIAITHGNDDDEDHVHLSWSKTGRNEMGFVRLSRDVVWLQDGSINIGGLPETLRMSTKGKHLRDVIDHPVLNTLDKRVIETRTEVYGGLTYLVLDIGYQGVGLSTSDMMGSGPQAV